MNFAALAMMKAKKRDYFLKHHKWTDRKMDKQTDGETDKASYRVAIPRLQKITVTIILCSFRYIVGNHLGPYLGQPPTGKLVRYRFAFNWYLANGKVRKK